MACRACGFDHSPLIRCEVAAATNRIATNADATNTESPRKSAEADAVEAVAVGSVTKNRRTRESYNRYQRDYMRKYRARIPS